MEIRWRTLPFDAVDRILAYDGRIRNRRGKYMTRIPAADARYALFQERFPRRVLTDTYVFRDATMVYNLIRFSNRAFYLITVHGYSSAERSSYLNHSAVNLDGVARYQEYGLISGGNAYWFRKRHRPTLAEDVGHCCRWWHAAVVAWYRWIVGR